MRTGPVLAALATAASLLAGSALADEATVRAALKQLIPNATIDTVKDAPVPGFSEVIVGGQVIYVSNDGKYLMQGLLYDVAARQDLTERSMRSVRKKEMDAAPVKERIIFSPPNGKVKHRVAVFTDIDCGYCQRLHSQMAQYNELGIEIQYLLFPRAGVPSDASRKAVAVWCAADNRAALTDAKAGKDPGNAECANPIEAQYHLGQKVGVSGTPSIVMGDGSFMPGYLPPQDLLSRLDAMAKDAAGRDEKKTAAN